MKVRDYLTEKITIPAIRSRNEGFWISPKSEVLQIKTTHIDTVISMPEKFGMTRQEIDDIYTKHGEQIGIEGEAREEIIVDLVRQGWIRVRQYPSKGWSINIGRMTKKIKDILYDWANAVINSSNKIDKFEFVTVDGLQYNKKLTLNDIAQDALYEHGETFDVENSVIIVESAKEFTWLKERP